MAVGDSARFSSVVNRLHNVSTTTLSLIISDGR